MDKVFVEDVYGDRLFIDEHNTGELIIYCDPEFDFQKQGMLFDMEEIDKLVKIFTDYKQSIIKKVEEVELHETPYAKVVKICSNGFAYHDNLVFDNGYTIYSYHEPDCCEQHYLSLGDLTMDHFEGLVFDLTDDGKFFNPVPGFGIELLPVNGFPIRIPGYASNNGYYSENLSLGLSRPGHQDILFDIEHCQSERVF